MGMVLHGKSRSSSFRTSSLALPAQETIVLTAAAHSETGESRETAGLYHFSSTLTPELVSASFHRWSVTVLIQTKQTVNLSILCEMPLLTAHVGSPHPLTKQWYFPFLLTHFPPLSCHVTHTLAQLKDCCRSVRRDKASSSQSAFFDSHFRVINNGISLVVMILESFFLFISPVSEPRLGGDEKVCSSQPQFPRCYNPMAKLPLAFKNMGCGLFHLPVSETLLSLGESTYPQKHIQVLKPTRKHRNNIQ